MLYHLLQIKSLTNLLQHVSLQSLVGGGHAASLPLGANVKKNQECKQVKTSLPSLLLQSVSPPSFSLVWWLTQSNTIEIAFPWGLAGHTRCPAVSLIRQTTRCGARQHLPPTAVVITDTNTCVDTTQHDKTVCVVGSTDRAVGADGDTDSCSLRGKNSPIWGRRDSSQVPWEWPECQGGSLKTSHSPAETLQALSTRDEEAMIWEESRTGRRHLASSAAADISWRWRACASWSKAGQRPAPGTRLWGSKSVCRFINTSNN